MIPTAKQIADYNRQVRADNEKRGPAPATPQAELPIADDLSAMFNLPVQPVARPARGAETLAAKLEIADHEILGSWDEEWRKKVIAVVQEGLSAARAEGGERLKVMDSIMANLPDSIVLGSNGSWIGVKDVKGTRYYPEGMDEKEQNWFRLFILQGMLGVLLRARAALNPEKEEKVATPAAGGKQ